MELKVSLGIYGIHPDEVSRILGVEATKRYAIGDVRKNGRIVQRHSWSIDSPFPSTGEDFDRHVTALLAMIDSEAWAGLNAAGPYEAQLGCYMRFDARYQVGISISKENVSKLQALSCSLDFDLYPDMERMDDGL